MFDLTGKSAIVTGAAQGIGQAYAEALSYAGARVAVLDINIRQAQAVAQSLLDQGLSAIAKQVDVTDEEQVNACLAEVQAEWGKIDIVVSNVGVGGNDAAEVMPLKDWRHIIDVNLNAMFLFVQAAGRILLQQKEGVIINTASMSSIIVPHPQKQAAYNASKAAVVQLTRSLASEWGASGIRVNCISPGIVDTPMINTDALKPLKEQWISQNPLKRLARVDDLKGAIVFLASDESLYVNGHNLVVDGGHTLW